LTPVYECEGLSVRYATTIALEVPRIEFEPGQLVAVVGPNGAGKSTLLNLLAGLQIPSTGRCLFRGEPLASVGRRRLAAEISFVPQQVELAFPFTAGQVVMMGRTPHSSGLLDTDEDRASAESAMRRTGSAAFRDRDIRTLSGGERQRVILASALAQSSKVLLLDEPTAHLDLKHQHATFRLLRQLADEGSLVITATHDLHLASLFAHRVVVLHRGRLAADGLPEVVLTPDIFVSVFEIDVASATRYLPRA